MTGVRSGREKAHTHMHTPCPCLFLFLRCTVSSLMFCWLFLSFFPVDPFLSLEFVVTVVVSPCRVQRIRLSTLLPLALNTAPRYCLSLALALFSLCFFFFPPFHLLINTFLSPHAFLCLTPADVQFLCSFAQTVLLT